MSDTSDAYVCVNMCISREAARYMHHDSSSGRPGQIDVELFDVVLRVAKLPAQSKWSR